MASIGSGRLQFNAYDLLLITCILRIRAGISHSVSEPTWKHYAEINNKTDLSIHTIRKLFGDFTESAKIVDVTFNDKDDGNEIFRSLKINNVRNVRTYQKYLGLHYTKDFKQTHSDLPGSIPSAYPYQLNDDLRYIIADLVLEKLQEVIEPPLLEGMNIFSFCKTQPIKLSPRLRNYFNTIWYCYLYFPMGNEKPQLIRKLIIIGDDPNDIIVKVSSVRL